MNELTETFEIYEWEGELFRLVTIGKRLVGMVWEDCAIYYALADGAWYVREKEDFLEKFKNRKEIT